MIHNLKKKIFTGIFLSALSVSVWAVNVPPLNGRVNDNARLMTSREKQEAEEYMAALESKSGVQIAVLTVKSLRGESLEEYSMNVAEKWQLGDKGKDNGCLLLVAYDERGVRIETGYGLEGSLTDTKCGLIIRNVIIPEFKEGDYGEGILKGVKAMGGVVSGDVETEKQLQKNEDALEEDVASALFAMIFILIWAFIVLSALLRRYGIWGLFIWNMMGRRGPRPRRPYNRGSNINSLFTTMNVLGGGKSGFGGGFSGGGGHFGGGGASGHW